MQLYGSGHVTQTVNRRYNDYVTAFHKFKESHLQPRAIELLMWTVEIAYRSIVHGNCRN